MAATDTIVAAEPRGLYGWVTTVDHKRIGRMYLVMSLAILGLAGVFGQVLAAERLDAEGLQLIPNDVFTQAYTYHAVAAVFGFLMPLLLGLALAIVPLQVGATGVSLPRAAAASFWGWFLSMTVVELAYLVNGGPFGGSATGVDLWIVGMGGVVVSLLVGWAAVVTTVLVNRAPGLRLGDVPAFAFSCLVSGSLLLIVGGQILAVLVLNYVDHRNGRILFGGNTGLYGSLRFAFAAPVPMLLVVPALGAAADAVPVLAGARQPLPRVVLFFLGLIGGVGAFGSLGTVLHPLSRNLPVSTIVALGLAIVASAGLLGLLGAGLLAGKPRPDSPLLFGLGAVLLTLIGAAAAALRAIPSLELYGTTWETGARHLILIGGGGMGALCAIHLWAPKLFGRPLGEAAGKVTAGLFLVGAAIASLPDLAAGAIDPKQPSFVSGYVSSSISELTSTLAALGGLITLLAVAIFVLNVASTAAKARKEPGEADPWQGHTLEWATASPPVATNFGELPPITSERPLLDAREKVDAK